MPRPRMLIISLAFAAALLPTPAAAQGLFDPIIPDACKCASVPVEGGDSGQMSPSAASWGCVLLVVQSAINALVGLAAVVLILAIAYAGLTFMTAGANPAARIRGRNVVVNALVGLFVILMAWLIVDFVMKAVYDPSKGFGPWNAIWSAAEDSQCLVAREPTPITSGIVEIIFGPPGSYLPPQVGIARAPCADSNPACSVSAISAYGLNENQARAMSCIAMTESGGNPNTPNSSTGACGTFQITTQPGNWSIPAYHQGDCTVRTSCNNARCNLQTAMLMFRDRGYQPWTGVDPRTGRHWNPNAVACVSRYDPGH